jgi:hypothetical protein
LYPASVAIVVVGLPVGFFFSSIACELRKKSIMSRWFRSEPMEYISLIVNEDAAHDCLADLGKLGVIQFTDVSWSYTV